MVSFVLKDVPDLYFDRISSALFTISKVVDYLHAVLSKNSKGEFWRSIKSLFQIAQVFPKEALESILDNVYRKPDRNFLMLRNFV